MPLFTPYFSLDSSAFRVGNGGRLRCRMGASGIGIYVMLLSHLRDCRDCRAPLDYDMLAFDLHEDAAAVRRVVEDFGLFDIDRSSGTFTSSVLTTVRGMLSDDASAAGVGTTRTVRQRRVRSSGETYRRAVRRLAEDNALPPAEEEAPAEGDAEPAEELPTSSENEITPAEGETQPAELDAPLADEENATGDFAPTSIAAEAEPAEVKHEAADADAAPAEGEHPAAEEEDVPTVFADAHSPRREKNRKEQNKKPHTPIVPFPQSGKGTRASHPAAAVVGAQEGGDASSEGNEEPVVGNPHSVPSASAERDAPPCAAAPTVLGTPAQTLAPHPNPDTENPNERDTHSSGKMQNGTSSVPNGRTSAEKGRTSAEKGEMSVPNSQPNPLTASERTAHPQTDTENGASSVPNGESSTENKEMGTNHSLPNTLTTSEKSDEAGRGEEGAGEPFVPPTANEVRRFAETLRHPEFDAEWFVAYYTERHWRRHNGRPVVSWQTTARYWLDHPLRVARHLLGHRPAASLVSVGVGGPSAVVVPPACPAAAKPVAGSASFPSTGTPPVGTGVLSPRASASSPHSGTPHVGSLSLPAPTPLQQSRLSDLKGMVLHLFADAPAAAPTSATAAPDLSSAAAEVPASAPAAAPAASPSVCPARFISPAEAAQVIAQQTLAAAEAEAVPRVGERRATDSEEEARIGEISPADAAKAVETQVLSPADAKEYVRSCDDWTMDSEEKVDAQALSSADAEEKVDAQAFSTTDAAKGIDTQALSPADAAKAIDTQAFSTADAAKAIDTQAFSTADAKEDIDAQAFSTTDTAKDIDAQAFSTADAAKDIDALAFSTDKERWGVRSPRGPDPPTGDGHDSTDTSNDFTDAGNDFADTGNDFADAENHFTAQPSNFSADRHSPAAVGTARAADPPIFADDECRSLRILTEKHPYLNPSFHEPHPSFASTRRRLAGSATHSVFSQHNLRSAAPSSVASSTSAPPAPSEADLFAPVSPSAAPNAADADSNTPTANAQPPQTPPNAPQTPSNTAPTGANGTNTLSNAPQTPSDPPQTPPNTAPTGANSTILPPNAPQTPSDLPKTSPNTTPDAPKTPISSTPTPSAGTKPSATSPNTPSTGANGTILPPNTPQTPPNAPQTPSAHPPTGTNTVPNAPKTPISSTPTPPAGTKSTATSPNTSPTQENTPTAGTKPSATPPNTPPADTKPTATSPNTPPTSANGTILPPNTPPTDTKSTATSSNTPPTSPNTPPTTSTPGSTCSVRPHTDAPCGPSAKLAVVPFATWPTVASHSDTPEAERPHWRARLLEHYSPERQVSFGEHPEWCYSSPRPTLRRLRDQLGSETVVTWLCLQLNYAAQLWGTADGLTSHQLRGAAEAIGASYAELNVGEVMVYLCRLRGGRYGKVAYGSLSADAMVSNLPLYMKERREELSQHERRAADRALAEELDARAARCCTHAQYKVLHARARVLAGGDEAEALRLLEERFWETDTGAASPAEAAR